MIRTPSSKAAWASGLVLGSTTAAIGLTATAPGAGALCAQPNARSAKTIARARLVVTADLVDAVEGDARLTGAAGQAQLGLLGVLVLGQAREGLADGLGVLVVDADLQRARVARLVGVDGLVFDHDDDLLQLVAVHLLLVFLEILGDRRVVHGLAVGLVALADARERGGGPLGRAVGHDVEVGLLGLLEPLGLLLEHLAELPRLARDLDPLVVEVEQLPLDVARLGRVVAGLFAAAVAALAVGRQRPGGGLLGGALVARLELRVGLAGQRLDGLGVAGVGLAVGAEAGGGAPPVLLVLAHDGGLEGDVLGVGAILVAPRVLAVVLDGAIVLSEALAEDAGAAERVGRVAVLRILLGQLLVERGRLVVVGDVLLDARGGEERLGRLAGRRVLVGQLAVGAHRLVGLLLFLVDRARVVERLGRQAVLRVLVRDAQEEGRRLVVVAALRVLLARLHDRADDQLVEPLLLVARGEGLGLLEPPGPALDVLVVLGLAERLQDLVAGGARGGIAG